MFELRVLRRWGQRGLDLALFDARGERVRCGFREQGVGERGLVYVSSTRVPAGEYVLRADKVREERIEVSGESPFLIDWRD